jgi:hypothetical protein
MRLEKKAVLLTLIISLVVLMYPSQTFAAESQNSITISPINEELSMKRTITSMNVPEDNTLSWGIVRGGASDYVERYPVIIQFYKDDAPVHVAQVDVKGDGSYEYKFRVRNIDNNTGEIIDIFEGQYTVKIFRVIHNQNDVI